MGACRFTLSKTTATQRLSLHPIRRQLLQHALTNALEHGRATRQHDVDGHMIADKLGRSVMEYLASLPMKLG